MVLGLISTLAVGWRTPLNSATVKLQSATRSFGFVKVHSGSTAKAALAPVFLNSMGFIEIYGWYPAANPGSNVVIRWRRNHRCAIGEKW